MSGPGNVGRRAAGWRLLGPSEGAHRMIAAWASTWGSGASLFSDLGVAPPPRTFSSTEHLSTEAVAAYVDSELQTTAFLRASAHLGECAECTAAVRAQRQARSALRQSGQIRIPPDLLRTLRSIPHTTPDGAGPGPARGGGPGEGRR